MSITLYNPNTTTNVDIVDFGITVLPITNKSMGSTSIIKIRNSIELIGLITAGTLEVRDPANSSISLITNDALALIYGTGVQEVSVTSQEKTGEDKINVQNTPRPIITGKSFQTVWTGRDDDIAGDIIGGGQMMVHNNIVGTAGDAVTKDYKFISTKGDIYIHEAHIMYVNAGANDCFEASVYASATPLQTTTSLDLEIVNSVVIKSAVGGAGSGTHGFDTATGNPVLVPSSSLTGFWDYDGTNIIANATTTGAFNLYNIDVEVYKMFNHVPVVGSSNEPVTLVSYDSEKLIPDYYIKVKTINNSNTVWDLYFFITVFREQTV